VLQRRVPGPMPAVEGEATGRRGHSAGFPWRRSRRHRPGSGVIGHGATWTTPPCRAAAARSRRSPCVVAARHVLAGWMCTSHAGEDEAAVAEMWSASEPRPMRRWWPSCALTVANTSMSRLLPRESSHLNFPGDAVRFVPSQSGAAFRIAGRIVEKYLFHSVARLRRGCDALRAWLHPGNRVREGSRHGRFAHRRSIGEPPVMNGFFLCKLAVQSAHPPTTSSDGSLIRPFWNHAGESLPEVFRR